MRRMLLGLVAGLMLVGAATADVPVPPRTKSTAPKPKLDAEPTTATLGGTSLLAGAALSLAVVSGGLVLIRRRHPRTGVEV